MVIPDGLEKAGIAAVAIFALWIGYKVFLVFVQQWKNSTDSLNRNTKSFDKLATVIEKQAEREEKYQNTILSIVGDTQTKVSELHGTLLKRGRAEDRKGETT